MFTGIVTAVGWVTARRTHRGDVSFLIETGRLDLEGAVPGESIAVNGVCLTAVDLGSASFWADVSAETLSVTTLQALEPGHSVNLERAVRVSERLGGHLVSGHVDGIATLVERHADGRSERLTFGTQHTLMKYIAAKGSVCLDGVSLTVNEAGWTEFGVNIVPHTAEHTTLGRLTPGDKVNLEVDLVARYLERLASFSHNGESGREKAD